MGALDPGDVLLDNTTIFGARYAYNAWPPRTDDWFEGSNAVNIRSLMDVLEAVVLYDGVVIDSSSAYTGRDPIWPGLYGLKDEGGESFVHDVYFASAGEEELITPLVRSALGKLLVYLRTDAFVGGLEHFFEDGIDFVVPEFYTDPRHFRELLWASFSFKLKQDEIQPDLRRVEGSLSDSAPEISNYAMFAFRGFYYRELAHLFSLSYSPHTWRSNLVDVDTDDPPVNFVHYVTGVASQVRQELAERLNAEFKTTNFTSEFPVIASYVAHQCDSRSRLLDTALEVRHAPSVKVFRRWLKDIQISLRDQRDLPRVARAQSELEAIIAEVRKELGLVNEEKTERVRIKLGVPTAFDLRSLVRFEFPERLAYILRRQTHLVFLRDVTKKSVSLSPFAYRYHQLAP
jgi:hypothetical protein